MNSSEISLDLHMKNINRVHDAIQDKENSINKRINLLNDELCSMKNMYKNNLSLYKKMKIKPLKT